MDCVGCEKCRLWGKLQVLGLGTALKILFSVDSQDHLVQPVSCLLPEVYFIPFFFYSFPILQAAFITLLYCCSNNALWQPLVTPNIASFNQCFNLQRIPLLTNI